jgi:hypothetical protein
MCPFPLLSVLLYHVTIHVAKAKTWFQLMQLLNDYLLPLPALYPVFNFVRS